MQPKASAELIDAITALDLQTMYDWRAGDPAPLDAEAQRVAVAKSLETGEAVTTWREDALAAYALFVPRGQGLWFASGIALNPDLAGTGHDPQSARGGGAVSGSPGCEPCGKQRV
ncbi:MAG: hypothetical protein P8X50_02230 [Maritimibacter sp.]